MERAQADGMLKSEHFLHLRCEVSAEQVVETFERLVDDPFVRLVSVMDHTPGQRQWADFARWRQFNSRGDISSVELDVSARRLAAENLVDGLASDYVPMSLVQACLFFHEAMGMGLPEAVATVTAAPASMVGLADRGEVAVGLRADLAWIRAYDHMPVIRGVWREGIRVV
jgi:alpha-D-ribose 1-methylphosphonate 5-triphosphate diphosphatase PhnM